MTQSYRDHFVTVGAGFSYDRDQYAPGSIWDLVWEVEKPILEGVVEELRGRVGEVRYLDFACGTGRILAYLEERCDEAIGIDVSEEMLRQAAARVARARLVRSDITVEGSEVEGRYDLITAFRFLLNAEPDLRKSGLRALACRLRDANSRLVINGHGNPLSFKAILWPVRKLRSLLTRRKGENLLSSAEVRRLLAEAGFEVVSVHGMGFLPGKLWRVLPRNLGVAVERTLARVPLLARFGVNQVFVCRSR